MVFKIHNFLWGFGQIEKIFNLQQMKKLKLWECSNGHLHQSSKTES